MHEVAQWARMTASTAGQVPPLKIRRARNPRDSHALAAQHRLAAASHAPLDVHGAAQIAHERQPVSAAGLRLLHAIPANTLPVRRRPAIREPAPDLSRGTSNCAERTRHAARFIAPPASACRGCRSGRVGVAIGRSTLRMP